MRAALIQIGIFVALWAGVLLAKPRLEARFSQFAIGKAVENANPFYPQLAAAAAKYGVDVSFMKEPIKTRTSNLYDSEIFTQLPHSYDVIVFGDSSLVWSFSPQVMAQAMGKRVAFFGIESTYPNAPFIALAEQLSKTYLKRDGVPVFLFAPWTWGVGAHDVQPVREMAELVHEAESHAIRLPFERAVNSILSLPRLDLYAELIEARLDPERYAVKHELMFGRGCNFYSWGLRSNAFLLHCDLANGAARPKAALTIDLKSTLPASCANYTKNPVVTENLRALAVADLPHKAIAIPYDQGPLDPAVYCAVAALRDNLQVIDLPRVTVEKYGIRTLEFESASHLANTSSIPASVILARELATGVSTP